MFFKHSILILFQITAAIDTSCVLLFLAVLWAIGHKEAGVREGRPVSQVAIVRESYKQLSDTDRTQKGEGRSFVEELFWLRKRKNFSFLSVPFPFFISKTVKSLSKAG